jgi:glyoxalase family protein
MIALRYSCEEGLMARRILGLHHVTAIAGDPQRNVDFYSGFLGLRMVKQTINFDDPDTYHLYYGDKVGHPGTILTFFPWPGAPKGRRGNGQLTTVSFSIPHESFGFWHDRLNSNSVTIEKSTNRFDEEVIAFLDPDGLLVELVAHAGAGVGIPWEASPVPEKHAIRGFYGVTLSEEGYERTASMLTQTLGFRLVRTQGNRFRYETGEGGPGATVDVICLPDELPGVVAVGTVHHVAWRTPTDEEQKEWRREIAAAGLNVTPVIDRRYFHSIYFREPGGVLFEIATDPPGFLLDEPMDQLGSSLQLPPWLEPERDHIVRRLPALRVPQISYV